MAKLDLSIYGITDVKEILHMKNCTRQKQTRNWKGTKKDI